MVRRLLIIGGSVALLFALLATASSLGFSWAPCVMPRCRLCSDLYRPACKAP